MELVPTQLAVHILFIGSPNYPAGHADLNHQVPVAATQKELESKNVLLGQEATHILTVSVPV